MPRGRFELSRGEQCRGVSRKFEAAGFPLPFASATNELRNERTNERTFIAVRSVTSISGQDKLISKFMR